MSNYTFNRKYITKSAVFLIEVIKTKLDADGLFVGIGMKKEYKIDRISSATICYTGKGRNQGKPEDINIKDMKTAIDALKKLKEFNTNTNLVKEKIPKSLYRKRTPLFGILTHAGIIVEVQNGK